MKLKIAAATLIAFAVATAQSANAATQKRGVVEAVNPSSNTFIVTDKQGRTTEYRLADHAKVIVDGEEKGIAALAPSQQVTVALASPSFIKARLLSFDTETGLAQVRPIGSKHVVSIRFTAATKVGGKAKQLNELAEGQIIKIR